jgi:hypothetical protein
MNPREPLLPAPEEKLLERLGKLLFLKTSGGAQLRAGIGGMSRFGWLSNSRASPMSASFTTKSCKGMIKLY